MKSAIAEPSVKDRLRANTDELIARGDIASGRVSVVGEAKASRLGYWLVAPLPQWRQKKVKALVATLMDTSGMLIYFGIAVLMTIGVWCTAALELSAIRCLRHDRTEDEGAHRPALREDDLSSVHARSRQQDDEGERP